MPTPFLLVRFSPSLHLDPLLRIFIRNVSNTRPPPLSPPENTAARAWIEKFTPQSIPRGEVELTFARSSGPGGQVNCWFGIGMCSFN
jgi:hypothetical protein